MLGLMNNIPLGPRFLCVTGTPGEEAQASTVGTPGACRVFGAPSVGPVAALGGPRVGSKETCSPCAELFLSPLSFQGYLSL